MRLRALSLGAITMLIALGYAVIARGQQSTTPTPYNPYPPVILPPDLNSEIARVQRDVDGERHHRGSEKKQHLLDYIRKHPEELRPISRKLLN